MPRPRLSRTEPTVVQTVRLTRDIHDRVRQLARANDRAIGAEIRRIVREHVEAQ